MSSMSSSTIGSYLAKRLEQIGIEHYFALPGDYNLVLLDQLLLNPKLTFIGCCNELNLGYACDGYARAKGVAAGIVTFSVGGLSAINAIAGAYAEDLAVIFLSGAPNTNSFTDNRLLHHTLGETRYNYQLEMFKSVTAKAVSIKHVEDAPELIDRAINACLRASKPVYIEIACNLAGMSVPSAPNQKLTAPIAYDEAALEAAIEQAANILNSAVKPVLVGGIKLRSSKALTSFRALAEKAGWAVGMMANAKGLFPENHPQYIGIYWGQVSSSGCAEIVESADAYLFAGPVFTDYTTAGYTTLINRNKLIQANSERVTMPGFTYNNIPLNLFLEGLAQKIKPNPTSINAFNRFRPQPEIEEDFNPDRPLLMRRVVPRIEKMLDANTTVIAETGDSWFNGIKLNLPEGAGFEIQMQYGSIGWSVGATLGYAVATNGQKRVIALIGDGSFQLTAQELSTMIRCRS